MERQYSIFSWIFSWSFGVLLVSGFELYFWTLELSTYFIYNFRTLELFIYINEMIKSSKIIYTNRSKVQEFKNGVRTLWFPKCWIPQLSNEEFERSKISMGRKFKSSKIEFELNKVLNSSIIKWRVQKIEIYIYK